MTNDKRVGYTTGVFDLFHIGHLNLLRHARDNCDHLVVGVTTDDLVAYKGKSAVIPLEERLEIVKAIRHVDEVRVQSSLDKLSAWREVGFHVMFVGDDWAGTPRWKAYEEQLAPHGVTVEYLPYTATTSSTKLRAALEALVRAPSIGPSS
jgi:glycerol-3-phosphate cytidylyltransferase